MINKNFQAICVFILLTLWAILIITQTLQVWSFTIDDAFITLRYAQHLASGHGIVWNINQAPVEGYSNFSYVLLAALFFYLHLPALVCIKIFSILCLIGTCLVLYRTLRLWVKPSIALLAPILLICYRGTIVWGASGLETAFYQFLIALSVYLIVKALDYKATLPLKYFILSGCTMALAALTRPEAPVLWLWFICLLGFIYFKALAQHKKQLLLAISLFTVSFLIIYIPYFSWKIFYFGHLFPNAVACKFMASQNKFKLIADYLAISFPLLILSLSLIKLADFRHLFLWTPSLIYCVILYGADPIIAYLIRHFLAVFSLLTVSAIWGLSSLLSTKKCDLPEKLQDSCVIFFALLYGVILLSQFKQTDLDGYIKHYSEKIVMRHQISHWLSHHMTPQQSVVISDCGIIPYYSKVEAIDSLCLNSLEMTSKPINHSVRKFVSWLLFEKKPAVIIITRIKTPVTDPGSLNLLLPSKLFSVNLEGAYNYVLPVIDKKLLYSKQFDQDYQFKKTFEIYYGTSSYQYLIYMRTHFS